MTSAKTSFSQSCNGFLNHLKVLLLLCAGMLVFVAGPQPAGAEGYDQLGPDQAMSSSTDMYVDIIDDVNESIAWVGNGSISVYDPDGNFMATLSSGQNVAAVNGKPGAYYCDPGSTQIRGNRWDVRVYDRNTNVTKPGRLYSKNWIISTGSYTEARSLSGSVYALAPGGQDNTHVVIQLDPDGFSGYSYRLAGNSRGVDGRNAGRSVPASGNSYTPEYKLYLNIPEVSNRVPITPTIGILSFSGGGTNCDAIAPGQSQGTFSFTTDVYGTYHLMCDLNGDGFYNIAGNEDLLMIDSAVPGENPVYWDGLDNAGNPVANGVYNCKVRITVGEFHYVGYDIETSYEGFRLYEVNADDSRTPMAMFWNDELVTSPTVTMPNGQTARETSGPNGIMPNAYGTAANCDVNGDNDDARCWGNFSSGGKGNGSYLDTFAWARAETSSTIQVEAKDGTLDWDNDGASDFLEECELGTDPQNPDTDGDGISDGDESNGGNPIDTDGDGIIDALDDDSDGDGILDIDEGGGDTDGDGIPDYRDTDSDGDGIPDEDDTDPYTDTQCADDDADGCDDCASGSYDPANDGLDSDLDGICNVGDTDDDNDTVLDVDDTDPVDPYVCRDVDADSCDDCAVAALPQPANDGTDTDSDGACNFGDLDDDNDTVPDAGDTDPLNPFICTDADSDTCDDCAVVGLPQSGNDGLDSDFDGLCDAGDIDDDNDGVADGSDTDPLNPFICTDADSDTCDDCAVAGSAQPFNDGPDNDSDGACDAGDNDDDNDGVADGSDSDPFNRFVCSDTDSDTCEDCVSGTYAPANDGTDSDSDGLCDAGDNDDDNDTVPDGSDTDPVNPFICQDSDSDTCDDCAVAGNPQPDNDGLDTDSDGLCDFGDTDDDNDGVPDGLDGNSSDPFICTDIDSDGATTVRSPEPSSLPMTDRITMATDCAMPETLTMIMTVLTTALTAIL